MEVRPPGLIVCHEYETDTLIYVNSANIAYFMTIYGKTSLVLLGGAHLLVNETPQQIAELLYPKPIIIK